ncbi:protein translocase subunit SecDF [bacterium]|nr:protein translocase subunit SecDF [bacterium]
MQNKGVIRLFAILFALACLYQLSFTYVSRKIESDAKSFASGDPIKEKAYLDSMASQEVYNVLVDKLTYKEVKEKELNLGLDLRGGMNVILEVQVRDILSALVGDAKDPAFVQALNNTDKALGNSQSDYLSVFLTELRKARPGTPLNDPKLFGTKAINDVVGFNADDAKIEAELNAQIEASVANVFTVLRARIDQFGVVQPNIQRLENNAGRILVELPGVKDPERVKKLLQSTAELEFWDLYEGAEFLGFLNSANEKLKAIYPDPKAIDRTETPEAVADPLADIQAVVDDPPQTDSASAVAAAPTTDSLETDSIGASAYNPLFSILYPNYDFENNRVGQGPVLGTVLIKDTGKVMEYLNHPAVRALLPAEQRYARFVWTAKVEGSGEALNLLVLKSNREDKAPLTGEVIVDARNDFDERNQPSVTMQMNAIGAQKWQAMTKAAAAQTPQRSVAVVLDGYVYSFPRVQGEIPGGNTQITGSFSVEEAMDLANILKAGKLPAPARIIQADVVGPSLGKEAVQAGLWSFAVAMLIVLAYMIFYYGQAGIAANVALVANMFFIFGVLASLGAVLTLPGLAGIVLTIGMAVDANVLIFERIREEMRHGKGLRLAIEDGYKHAYSSIIDANVTTLITAIILAYFGTGPIRGFATTLIVGILCSMFTAIFITRLIFEWQLGRKKDISFSTALTSNWFSKVNIDFLGKRKMAYGISGGLILLGLISLFTKGLNYGVDFVGGRSYQVRFDQPVNAPELRNALAGYFVDASGNQQAPEVKTIGSENQVVITTKFKVDVTGPEVEQELIDKMYEGTRPFFATALDKDAFLDEANGLGLMSQRQVGPTIADDIKQSAVWSVLISLAFIFLYILLRFSKLQFSLGAVAALFHDVLLVLGIFSIGYGILPFSLEIDQAFIAAILTVIGYSLNDTVVVFDRIREYFNTHSKRMGMKPLINEALNQTLSRTLNTSFTTLIVIAIIFVFGGEVIRGFMFALLVGIVVGTYSSLFVAAPLMYDTLPKGEKSEEDKA